MFRGYHSLAFGPVTSANIIQDFLDRSLKLSNALDLTFTTMGAYFGWKASEEVETINHLSIFYAKGPKAAVIHGDEADEYQIEEPPTGAWRLVYFQNQNKWAIVEEDHFNALTTAAFMPESNRSNDQRALASSLGAENYQWREMPQYVPHDIAKTIGLVLEKQELPKQPFEEKLAERNRIASLRLTARLMDINGVVMRHDHDPDNVIFSIYGERTGSNPSLMGSEQIVTCHGANRVFDLIEASKQICKTKQRLLAAGL